MKIEATPIRGVFRIEPAPHADARGAFARTYCRDAFAEAGVTADGHAPFEPMQLNLSRNVAAHTLRGMHHQAPPYAEAKLVSVARGAIYDVAVDLRPESPTFRRWVGAHLDAGAMTALFIPEGCAHGFLTLEPDTDVAYAMGRIFEPGHGRGFRWDDPRIGIDWPARPAVISERDAGYPDLA